jgi:hypothetical protein
MIKRILAFSLLPISSVVCLVLPVFSQSSATVNLDWRNVIRESRTSASMEVCVEPPMRRGKPIHDQLFQALNQLGANYVRLSPWHPYPRIAVAELEAPRGGKISWNFSLLDPVVEDFMQATSGHSVDMNISTIPEWMFKTEKPSTYPSDPDEITWDYEQGTEPRDSSMKEIADYWARVASWYTQGGFKDEYGNWHASDHHYKFDYWEVLNEVEYEHKMTPQLYTVIYDAIVTELHKIDPEMKFVGMGLGPSGPLNQPQWFEYFLNPKNHNAGIPLDAISYHFYAVPGADESAEVMSHTIYDQAEAFINVVRYIEMIRQRLSPQTMTHVNEVGTILPNGRTTELTPNIANSYWNLSGGMYAYLYGRLTQLGINVVDEAELIDYPGQYPGTTLVDWNTGKPNARYWILKLVRENLGPGDKLVQSHFVASEPGDESSQREYVFVQGFITRDGKRKVLLVNKRDRSFDISIPDGQGAQIEYVDQTTGFNPPQKTDLQGDHVSLSGLEVAVVTLAR